ncbi:hypothetical protein LCGC14_0194860 [marine sediment metagenome]|uniref:Uncharacterized protein n=1 Tax=marine sediment metagenome TaxID=412755 RepID=A0A0F9UPT4_9ZZZZ
MSIQKELTLEELLDKIYPLEEWIIIIDEMPVPDEHKYVYSLGVKSIAESGQELTVKRVQHLIENQINFIYT